VTAEVCKRLKDKHDIGIFAFYGLKGGMQMWNDIPVFPNKSDDAGSLYVNSFYRIFEADALISLMDIWVLDPRAMLQLKWLPYFPIDHDPMPPKVREVLKASYMCATMSKFGRKKAEELGVVSTYIPHGVDTKVYRPDDDLRKMCHEGYEIRIGSW